MSDETKQSQPGPRGKSGPGNELELEVWKTYYRMIRERWFFGLLAGALVACVVGFTFLRHPAVYRAEAALMLTSVGERVIDIEAVVASGLDDRGQMWRVSLENHINHLKSRSFRQYVVSSFTPEEAHNILAPYLPEDEDEPAPSVSGILGGVEIEDVPNSFVLVVRARHRDPEAAALIANRYVERYIDFVGEKIAAGNQAASRFLVQQAEEFREKMLGAEEALRAYSREHNLISVDENQRLIVQRLTDINASISRARVERIHFEGRLRQVDALRREGRDLLELADLLTAGSPPPMWGDLDRLRQERSVMAENYGPRHPRMIANQRAITTAEDLIRRNMEVAISDLRSRLENARQNEQALLDEMREIEKESRDLAVLASEYAVLQQAVLMARKSHSQILDRINETEITSQLESSSIQFIDHARASSNPVEPNLKRVVMLVVFLGGFFFLGTPIGLAALDNKLKFASEVEGFLGKRLLAEIAAIRGISERDRLRVVDSDSDDRAVEAFRGLLGQLQIGKDSVFPSSLLVTSTIPGEGKSFLISNLASSCAAHGKRTLMIDFDLRRPSLHRVHERLNVKGLLKWLDQEGDVHSDLMQDPYLGVVNLGPNLFLLPAGGQTKRATEVIHDPRIGRLLETLKTKFDVVLIDAPPMGIFSDASALAQLADQSVYVVRFGKVDRMQVKNGVKRLDEAKADFLGVVMNGMPRGARRAHYYSAYGIGNYDYSRYYATKDR